MAYTLRACGHAAGKTRHDLVSIELKPTRVAEEQEIGEGHTRPAGVDRDNTVPSQALDWLGENRRASRHDETT
jgi:hypothetical protein